MEETEDAATGASAPVELFTVEVMNAISAGSEIVDLLNSSPPGGAARRGGPTRDGVLKALKTQSLSPSSQLSGVTSYGTMWRAQRGAFEIALGRLSGDEPLELQTAAEAI